MFVSRRKQGLELAVGYGSIQALNLYFNKLKKGPAAYNISRVVLKGRSLILISCPTIISITIDLNVLTPALAAANIRFSAEPNAAHFCIF